MNTLFISAAFSFAWEEEDLLEGMLDAEVSMFVDDFFILVCRVSSYSWEKVYKMGTRSIISLHVMMAAIMREPGVR